MTSLYSVTQLRAIERAACAGLAPGTLMQRAGSAACEAALRLLSAKAEHGPILVLAGPGNNGGDALVAAALLAQRGMSVTVLLHADTAKYSSESQEAYGLASASKLRFICIDDDIGSTSWSLVIDGLFGIGLQRVITEPLRGLIEVINKWPCPILALDVPSGLDADRGVVVGDNGIAVRATHTITFIGSKPGLHTADGRDYAGTVEIADLDISATHFGTALASLNSPQHFAALLVPRKQNSHKGSYGDVAIMGGASGMGGAVLLSARAALFCGAGRVIAGFLEQAPALDANHPELMCRAAEDVAMDKATLVVGPGLGVSDAAGHLLAAALRVPSPLIIDADALNLIAARDDLRTLLAGRTAPAILTPHPLEAARLLATSIKAIQSDRLRYAQALATQLRCIVILKGAGSVIAHPDGRLVINSTGNPGLATPGSGDVLAGLIGALLSQHRLPWEAALAGVWLHGKAAEELATAGVGPIGLTAGELAPRVRQLINRLVADSAGRHA